MAANRGNKNEKDMLSRIDFHCTVDLEKKQDCGEDAWKRCMHRDAALFSVFDGCGGAGSKLSKFKFSDGKSEKTEAYVASHMAAVAVRHWFEEADPAVGWRTDELKTQLDRALKGCEELFGEASFLIGGIKKKFPTTAAIGICHPGSGGLEVEIFWVGDSRVYLLNDQGLAQLTEDDLGGIDAMENLTRDGLITNMINLSVRYEIHRAKIVMDRPGFIFAATDGCFGYLSTPMDFEYLLLESLLNSDSVAMPPETGVGSLNGFEERITAALRPVAGDDVTLCGYAVDFGSLENMKKTLIPRANEVYSKYISRLGGMNLEERTALWAEYKDNYYRMVCRP